MIIDIYSPYHGKIKLEKIVPKLVPLWKESEETEKGRITKVREIVRAKRLEFLNLFEDRTEVRSRPYPCEWKSILELSLRSYCCPYPFNIDPFESGGCFQCIYCFSVYAKSSLYTSWFDGYPWVPRFPSKEYLRKTLTEVLAARGVEPKERTKSNKKWCGSIKDSKALKKAAARRIPLRMGNRCEPFHPVEKFRGITLEALKVIKEFDYPLIINTKGTLLLEEPYFSLITSLDEIAIQVSIIHNDDVMAKRLEPLSPPSSERWRVIKTFNEVGISALPRLEPLMAFVNADDQHLEAYARKASECGVEYCLLDSYSYTTRSEEIEKAFRVAGFDFNRMFEATSEYQVLGSYIIQKASYYLKKYGIKTASFDFRTIPYNDTETCCAVDPVFGNWNRYNTFTATRLIVEKRKLTFKEFDDEFYGEELAPEIYRKVRDVWNLKEEDPWSPINCEGVYVLGEDENGDLIYGFDPSRVGESYENIIKLWGDELE